MIEASTVSVKTMADDTLRLTVDISPADAQQAFALFGSRGASVVIARFTADAAKDSAQRNAEKCREMQRDTGQEKPKGGELARLAGIWCEHHQFQWWAGAADAKEAADFVRSTCEIRSRAEIDSSERATFLFNELIREPFMDYCEERGIRL